MQAVPALGSAAAPAAPAPPPVLEGSPAAPQVVSAFACSLPHILSLLISLSLLSKSNTKLASVSSFSRDGDDIKQLRYFSDFRTAVFHSHFGARHA